MQNSTMLITTTFSPPPSTPADTLDHNLFGVCLYSLPVFFHTFGLYFIFKTRHILHPIAQWIYILNMAVCELVYSIVLIATYALSYRYPDVSIYLQTFAYMALGFWLFCTNVLIMVDRFMEVYLNIRYSVYWSERRSKSVVYITTLFCFSLGCVFAYYQTELSDVIFYVWICLDHLHIVVAMVTYGYLFTKVQANRRRTARVCAAVTNSNNNGIEGATDHDQEKHVKLRTNMKRLKKAFYLPTLFVLNFLFFTYTPDIIYFAYSYNQTAMSALLSTLMFTMYVVGFLVDALIYVFASKPIRRKLMKLFCSKFVDVTPSISEATSHY